MDAKTMDRLRPAILRRLKEAKASCPVTVHVKLNDAAKLIEEQAAEIARLRNGTTNHHPTGGTLPQPK